MDAVIKKLVLLCLVYPFAVHAQVAAPERTKNTIEEIIVSATKRDQSVRDIPISIDAFKGEDLENRGATNLEEIIKYSAGVTLQKGDRADNSSFTIRGIGGNTYYFSRTYGLFFSDVSLVNPTLQGVVPDIDPFDIASVEVLKGPQGTLFGGSSLAGAVRYVPTRPDFEDSYGSVSAGMGTMEDSEEIVEEYTLMLNAPLTSNFAVRGAGSVRHTPGYIDDHRFQKQDDTNAGDISSFRVMADWAISENLTLETTYLRRDSNTEQLGYIDNLEKRRETDSKTANESGNSDIEIFIGSLTWTGFEDFDLKLILAQLDKDSIQDYDFTAFFSYQNTGLRARVDDYISSTDQPSVELRMVSKDISSSDWWIMDGWQYVLGYYQQESDQINQFAYILGEPDPNFIEDDLGLGDIIDIPELTGPGLFADIFATAEEKALYFDLTKDMLDGKLQLGLGGRYYKQKSTLDFNADLIITLVEGLVTRTDFGGSYAEQSEEGFNPKASFTWFMAENYQLYGSIVKGFRYGGGNFDLGEAITGKIPPTYESDELWSYELGLRTDWLDGAVQADVTVFYIEWGDTQVNLLSEGGATQFNFIANVGAAEVQGFELSAKAALPFDLTLSGNTAYSDAIIVDAFDAPRGYVPSGTGMPNSPHWTASAVLAHSAYFNNWQLFSMLSVAYRSDAKHDYINPIVLEEHATFGAAIQLVNSSLPFSPELRFSVTNLTDEDEILTTNTSGDTNVDDGNIKATTVTPRTTVFSLKLNF